MLKKLNNWIDKRSEIKGRVLLDYRLAKMRKNREQKEAIK